MHPQTIHLYVTKTGLTVIVCCIDAYDARNAQDVKKREELIASSEQAIKLVRNVQDQMEQSDPLDLIEVLDRIGLFYAAYERYDEARSYFEQVLALGERYRKPDDAAQATAYCDLANLSYY